jgi:hypothetical protein
MRSGSGGRWRWLRSQGLGLVCGFATVLLLAVGSVVLTATRKGASASVGLDDLRGFFAPPRLAHAWLYLLIPIAALYAVNTVLATWDTVARKWRAGYRAPTVYAASIVHVGFLLALAGHAVGGFLGRDGPAVLVASGWQEVPGFGEARLLSLDVARLPDGMPREAWARLEVRGEGGAVRERTVGYNVPLSAGAGARLALLSDLGQAWVVHLASSAGDGCALAEGQDCALGGDRVELVRIVDSPRGPAAILRSRAPGGAEQVRALVQGGELPLASGRVVQLAELVPEPVIVLRTRETPGNPWALAASVVIAIGIVLLWPKLVRGRAGP